MSSERNILPDIFHVVSGSSEPIYRQLVEQVRRLAAGRQLQVGDLMPSVREVAAALGVNPMTVSKAYNLLEAENLLERRRGMGMAVAQSQRASLQQRLDLLRPGLERLAEEARQLELEPRQVLRLYKQILNGANQ